MDVSLLFPLDQIKPSQFLTQYREWIYFTLVLVFFISLAGITLRRHFDKPYVKPLIISVGLMLTVGVFMLRDSLTAIFEGWGTLGVVLLVIMAATIPYGLCRGFGVAQGRSFFLTYILVYIISWVQFPRVYYILSDHNLGLVNLGLLLLFFVAIFQVIRFRSQASFSSAPLEGTAPIHTEIERDMGLEHRERKAVKHDSERMTKLEIRSVEDIAEQLTEIEGILEAHRNNLPEEERKRIAGILKNIGKEEHLFTRSLERLKKLFRRMDRADLNHSKELKERLSRAEGKEREVLRAEVAGEEEKIRMEQAIFDFEKALEQDLSSFNRYLAGAVDHLRRSPYPYDAKPYLEKARGLIKDMMHMLKK